MKLSHFLITAIISANVALGLVSVLYAADSITNQMMVASELGNKDNK